MLVGGIVIEDRVDGLARGNGALDSIEEADAFLMAMALHVAADDRSVEDVHGREQGGRLVPKCCFASPDPHPANQLGIPTRIQISDLIH
jgi:hypothetical protein